MRLNLGCGSHPVEGWVNIDRSLGSRGFPNSPDLLADMRDLPCPNDSIEAVFCGHVLEHLRLPDVVDALIEVRRVLAPGGRLGIVGPDYDRAKALEPDMAVAIWPGSMDGQEWANWEGAQHEWLCTGPFSLELVLKAFPNSIEVPIADLDPYWPAACLINWQFAIEASKSS